MRLNFRKVASVLASLAMLGSTAGYALAANYPAPFVAGGTADAAIVVTSGTHASAVSDWDAAVSLQSSLQSLVTSGSTSSTGSVSGEASALFTDATKIYINDSLNQVKSVVTETELPSVLDKQTFSGDVDATYTQTISLGANPAITFAKQPTNSQDPQFGLALSTTRSNYIYNATVSFNKAVNFTNADSEGETITMFGQTFTVGSETDTSKIVLLKEAVKVDLDSSSNPSQEVTVGGKTYTVELVSASDTAATIKVTDSAGNSESKQVNEAATKKIQGLTLAVNNADETNFKLTASVVAGAEKVTLTNVSSVTVGDDDTAIDGTYTVITGHTGTVTKIDISVYAPNGDTDAILPGTSFRDPVFGSFKLDFAGLSIPDESTTARENIVVAPSGDDKLTVKMTDYRGNEKTVQYIRNTTDNMYLQYDSDGHNISISEMTAAYRNDYVVVGNEDEGRLVKVSQIQNQTTGYTSDAVKFEDVFSGDSYSASITAEGTGTVTIAGKVYSITYFGASDASEDTRYVKIDYPDSSTNELILYPTIQTSKGALVSFYKPYKALNLTSWNGAANTNISKIKFPNGDGYTNLEFTTAANHNWALAGASTETWNLTGNFTVNATVGQLKYTLRRVSAADPEVVDLYLINPESGHQVNDTALVIIEEKNDNSAYQAIVVTTEPGASGDDGIGVNDVVRTWSNDAQWDAISLASDSKKTEEADLYGTIAMIDSSDSDQKIATISYPDSQVYAQIYAAAESAVVTPGQTAGGGGVVMVVKDTEVNSVKDKNLIVIGGSCINSVAAAVLGVTYPTCSDAFKAATNVDAGKYLIKAIASPYNTAKTAVLVAGYEAAETKLAVDKLKAGAVTDKDTSNIYPQSSA